MCQPALQSVHPPGSSRASSREPRSEIPGATRPLPGTSSSSLRARSPKPTAANSSLRHGSVRCSNGQVHHSRSVGRPRDRCLRPQKQRSSAELSGADGSSWTAVGWRKQTKSKRKIQIGAQLLASGRSWARACSWDLAKFTGQGLAREPEGTRPRRGGVTRNLFDAMVYCACVHTMPIPGPNTRTGVRGRF